ncbi:MAG: hypothetical protein AAF771_11095 [Pseudomonadota bacterium]
MRRVRIGVPFERGEHILVGCLVKHVHPIERVAPHPIQIRLALFPGGGGQRAAQRAQNPAELGGCHGGANLFQRREHIFCRNGVAVREKAEEPAVASGAHEPDGDGGRAANIAFRVPVIVSVHDEGVVGCHG